MIGLILRKRIIWMQNRMQKIFLILGVSTISSVSFAIGDPFSYLNYLQDMKTAVNSATSLANQAQQIRNEVQSIQYQAKNSGHLNNYQYNRLTQLMQRMDQITNQGKSISYSAANIDQQFRTRYPNYANHQNARDYQGAYQNWNTTTLNTINNSMQANGAVANHFQNESQLMNQLRTQGKTATGRMQAMQVSTEIASENVNQLQELKRITLSQANAQNSYMAYRVSKDSYNEQGMSAIAQNTSSDFPAYQNNNDFAQIGHE